MCDGQQSIPRANNGLGRVWPDNITNAGNLCQPCIDGTAKDTPCSFKAFARCTLRKSPSDVSSSGVPEQSDNKTSLSQASHRISSMAKPRSWELPDKSRILCSTEQSIISADNDSIYVGSFKRGDKGFNTIAEALEYVGRSQAEKSPTESFKGTKRDNTAEVEDIHFKQVDGHFKAISSDWWTFRQPLQQYIGVKDKVRATGNCTPEPNVHKAPVRGSEGVISHLMKRLIRVFLRVISNNRGQG